MTVFDATAMRDDIVARLLQCEEDLETSRYLDRLVELAALEEAEHQFLIDPFDRSVALVFQLFRSKDLCLLYTSPSPRDATLSRMPSSA